MAVPMASLQRAATNPLARAAGTVTSAVGLPVQAPGSNPVPRGTPPLSSGQPPPPAPPQPPAPPPPVLTDPYGVVPRPPMTPPAPSAPARTPQQQADEYTALLARQRAADVAAGRRPAEIDPRDQIAEEQRKSNEFQMQRAAVARQQEEEARQRKLEAEARQRAEIEQIAAERQRQNEEARAFSTQLSRTPDSGAVARHEGDLDAGAGRADLAALVTEARGLGLLDDGAPSAVGSLRSAAAAPPPVTHAPANVNTSAAFSRAKDRVGAIGRSALDSLTRQFSGRGLSGSSLEGRAIGQAVEQGAGALSDTARSEAVAEADRQNAVDDQTYQGDISQRNTDLAAQQEAARLSLSKRNSQFSNLQGLMALVRRGRAY